MPGRAFRRFLVAVVAGIAVVAVSATHVLAPIDTFFTDAFVRLLPSRLSRDVAVVAIDEPSLQQIHSWPWSRTRMADLVSRIRSAGARAIGIDLLLNEQHADDAILAAACRPTRCVAASMLDENGGLVLPAASLRSTVDPAHAAFELDEDGVLRRISTTKQDAHVSLPAFALALAARTAKFPIASGRPIIPAFRTPPADVRIVSAVDVLRGSPAALQQLRGRVVVIGLTAFALGDRVITPRARRQRADPGVQVHAAAVESLLAGDTLREIPPITMGLLAAILTWFTALAGQWIRNMRRIAAELVFLALAFLIPAVLIFVGLIASPVATSAVVALTAISAEARHAIAMMRHGRAAADVLGEQIGVDIAGEGDVGAQLERLAAAIVRRRIDDVEAKRVVAHELKTPLASMRTLSQLLTGFDLSAAERRRLAMLLGDEAEKLQSMVSGLLEVERLSLRPRDEATERVDLGRLLANRVDLLSNGVERPIELSLNGSEASVNGDPALLARVVDNLVGNAIKYSPDAQPVSIALGVENGNAIIDVMDRGPGIPAADRDRIFTRFTRGMTSTGTEGLGLGLSLVQEAVRWHRGTVTLFDREGGGSIFRVRIPLAAQQRVAEAV